MTVHRAAADIPHPAGERAAAAGAILSIQGLNVVYPVYGQRAVRAVRGLDLGIAPGEILGLVGESGSGKTTLARAIMGLLAQPGRIDSGAIGFDGRDMRTLSEDEEPGSPDR